MVSDAPGLRKTVLVEGPLALQAERLRAAERNATGLEIVTMPMLAARLAGGFAQPAGQDVLYPIVQRALKDGAFTELDRVSDLPGTPRAVLRALQSLWLADLRASSMSQAHSRLEELGWIEARLREELPPRYLLLPDLRDRAIERAALGPTVLWPDRDQWRLLRRSDLAQPAEG